MNFELMPLTAPGRTLVALAEEHARDFASRADRHDRDGSFPFENFEAMQRSGLLRACVPVELGGLGVESLHDMILGINRLARGDGSTALGTTMHLATTWLYSRQVREARAAGNATAAQPVEETLRQIGRGEIIIAMIGSEAGTDLRHPLTEATRVDGGWRVNGSKTFGTLSPIADLLTTRARVADGDGGYLMAAMRVARDMPGLRIKETWDALGMRASGSNDLVFENCFVPEEMLSLRGRWGDYDGRFFTGLSVALGLTAVFLGIAEAARELAVSTVTKRRRAPSNRTLAERYATQHTIAALEIDLAAARAILGRSAARAAAFFAEHPPAAASTEDLHDLYKDGQCAKWFVNRKAIEIVDRALTATGGAGYMSANPLSRLYRDVRAGPFMAPLTENEAFEYIGKVALGLEPTIEG